MQSQLLPSLRPVLRPTPPRLQIPPAYSDARLLGNLSFTLLRSPPSHPLLSFARSPPPLRGLNAPTSSFAAAAHFSSGESERAKLAQVAKRLENTSRYFKRLGGLGFWGQLVCTIVSALHLCLSFGLLAIFAYRNGFGGQLVNLQRSVRNLARKGAKVQRAELRRRTRESLNEVVNHYNKEERLIGKNGAM